jgi:hypothetical protein
MNATRDVRTNVKVILAVLAVVGLGVGLAARLSAWSGGPTAAAPAVTGTTVPAPKPIPDGVIPIPCWSCAEAKSWPIQFRTDLDMLAPLGRGSRNAAEWFKDFAKPDGSRLQEAEAALARAGEHPRLGKALSADEPLLKEAEPWADQATMRFYPGIYQLEGFETRLPNLLLALNLAKGWAARGWATSDPDASLADFRRAVRLGRLVRQDNVTLIADLVGLACIRVGVEGIYETAAKQGDARLALLASVALSEVAPQRLLAASTVTETDLAPFVKKDAAGREIIEVPDARMDAFVARARTAPDTWARGEATINLGMLRVYGSAAQRDKARQVLDELAKSDNRAVAELAGWGLKLAPKPGYLATVFQN